MKDPSINIKRSELLQILKELEVYPNLANQIFLKAKGIKSNRDRVTIKKSSKTRLESLKQGQDIVRLFQMTLIGVRQQLGHSRITEIKPTSKKYTTLNKVAGNCKEFIHDMDIPVQQGVIDYVRAGLEFMGRKYGLEKFIYYHDKIVDRYRDKKTIEEDSDKELTQKIYDYYTSKVSTVVDFTVDFVYCRLDLTEDKADYRIWIDAQFSKLEYLNVVPEPNQLHGENAKKRYRSYDRKKASWTQGFK